MVQRDPLGNVLGLTTTAGAVKTDQLRTSEWGALFTPPQVNDTTTMRLRWKGMMYEADSTQLYYVRARWYDPQSRRFLSEDPIGIEGGSNPFTFGGNDPINHSDPEGLEWVCTDQMTWVFSGDLNGGWNTSTEEHTDCDWKDGGIGWDGILGPPGRDAGNGGGNSGSTSNDPMDALRLLGQVAPELKWELYGFALSSLPLGRAKRLEQLAKHLYPAKALRFELHHRVPKYLGGAVHGTVKRINAAYHQLITNEFRRLWPYGRQRPNDQQLEEILRRVYEKFPLP